MLLVLVLLKNFDFGPVKKYRFCPYHSIFFHFNSLINMSTESSHMSQ